MESEKHFMMYDDDAQRDDGSHFETPMKQHMHGSSIVQDISSHSRMSRCLNEELEYQPAIFRSNSNGDIEDKGACYNSEEDHEVQIMNQSSHQRMSLYYNEELEYQSNMFNNNCDSDYSIGIIDEEKAYYITEEDRKVQILSQDIEVSYGLDQENQGSVYPSDPMLVSNSNLYHNEELVFQSDMFYSDSDGDYTIGVIDEVEAYYINEEDRRAQILSQDIEVRNGLDQENRGSIYPSDDLLFASNSNLYHSEELEYKSEIFYSDSDGDYAIGIIDEVEAYYINEEDRKAQILSQDLEMSNGIYPENQRSIYPIDDMCMYNSNWSIPSEAEINALISLGRQGLLETNITEPTSPCYPGESNIQICKFFLNGECKYGSSGRDGGMCKYRHIHYSILESNGSQCYSSNGCQKKLTKRHKNKSFIKRLKTTVRGAPKQQHNGLKQVQQWLTSKSCSGKWFLNFL